MSVIREKLGKISSVKGYSVKNSEEGTLQAMVEFKIETSDLSFEDMSFFGEEIRKLIESQNPYLKQAVFDVNIPNLTVDYIPKMNKNADVETYIKTGVEGLIIPDSRLNGLTVVIKNNIPTFILKFVKEVDSRLVHLNFNCGQIVIFSITKNNVSVET